MSYLCLNINVVFFIKYVNCVSFFFIILFRVLIILFYFYWCFYFVFVIVLLDPRPMSFRPEGGPNFSFRCRPFHDPIKVWAGHKARPTMPFFFSSPTWPYFSRRKALLAEAIILSYVQGTFPCTFVVPANQGPVTRPLPQRRPVPSRNFDRSFPQAWRAAVDAYSS